MNASSKERREAIRNAMQKLPAQERDVIEKRFGISGASPMTLAEIGRDLGKTAQEVRDIEYSALTHLTRMNPWRST